MKKFFRQCSKSVTPLFCTVAAIAFFATPQSISAQQDKQIGIQLYSVMDAVRENPQTSVKRLADMGYNAFELVQWGGDPKIFGLPADEFKALCEANDVNIISTHSGIQEDPANEAEIMDRWRKLFEVQQACGGEYFIIPSYKVDYTTTDVKAMADYLNRVGALANEYGLKLGYHNHAQEYEKLKDSDDVMWEYLVENTDPDNVCYELDVYWCTKGNKNPVDYLKKYPERIKLLHVKDDFVIGESGTIDFENIFNQFYKNGMKDYVVEIEIPKELREKGKTPEGKKQIQEEMFNAAQQSAVYLINAPFVK